MKMYYICPETHGRHFFFNHYINKFMEVKKSPKADLEGKKSTWLLVGYVVATAYCFTQWKQGTYLIRLKKDSAVFLS